jgi:hypothetical protein
VIPQSLVLPDGRSRSWTVHRETLLQVAPWAAERPDILDRELSELIEHFPTWIVTFGRLNEGGGWPHASLAPCPVCHELLIPDRGVRCAACGRIEQPDRLLIGFAGRLPTLATGRPFLSGLQGRVAALRSSGRVAEARSMEACFLQVRQETFFAPPIWVHCPSSFPHGEPMVMVRPDYFEVLGIPPEHIYPSTSWRLCNYVHWTGVSVRTVLQQRIVPRIYLDLMIADLAVRGDLDSVLVELGLTLHALYNAVGRAGSVERFERLYRRSVEH